MTKWKNSDYAEADKGRFDAWLLKFNYSSYEYEAIASTYGDVVRLEKSATPEDAEAIKIFADQYDCIIE